MLDVVLIKITLIKASSGQLKATKAFFYQNSSKYHTVNRIIHTQFTNNAWQVQAFGTKHEFVE